MESLKESHSLISERLLKLLNPGTSAATAERKTSTQTSAEEAALDTENVIMDVQRGHQRIRRSASLIPSRVIFPGLLAYDTARAFFIKLL